MLGIALHMLNLIITFFSLLWFVFIEGSLSLRPFEVNCRHCLGGRRNWIKMLQGTYDSYTIIIIEPITGAFYRPFIHLVLQLSLYLLLLIPIIILLQYKIYYKMLHTVHRYLYLIQYLRNKNNKNRCNIEATTSYFSHVGPCRIFFKSVRAVYSIASSKCASFKIIFIVREPRVWFKVSTTVPKRVVVVLCSNKLSLWYLHANQDSPEQQNRRVRRMWI